MYHHKNSSISYNLHKNVVDFFCDVKICGGHCLGTPHIKTKQILKSFSGRQDEFFLCNFFLQKCLPLSLTNHKRILFSSKEKKLSKKLPSHFALKMKLFDKDKN